MGRQHRQPGLRRGAGLVPGRRGRGAEDQDRATSASSAASRSPLIKKFEAGFEAGAKAVKPDIKVEVKYLTQPPDFTGFDDPAKGKTAAEGMFDDGADVVYQAAGGSGGGVFEAAQGRGRHGHRRRLRPVQRPPTPAVKDVILTSMLKQVDVAVFDFIKSRRRRRVQGRPTTSST